MASLLTHGNIILSKDASDFLVKEVECRPLATDKGEMELRFAWNNKVGGVYLYAIPSNVHIDEDILPSLPYMAEIVRSEYRRQGKYIFSVKDIGAVNILILPWYREGENKRVALQMCAGDNILHDVIGRKARVTWKALEESNLVYRLRNKRRKVRIIIETTDPIPRSVLAFTYSGGAYEIDEEIEYKWDKTIIEPLKSNVAVCFASRETTDYAKMFQLIREDR